MEEDNLKLSVFKLYIDCGRNGELEGVFVAPQEYVDILVDEEIEVYWGEVLGKHSEVYGSIEDDEIEFITNEEVAVSVIDNYGLASGFNPFEYTCSNLQLLQEKYENLPETDEIQEIVEFIYNLNKNK